MMFYSKAILLAALATATNAFVITTTPNKAFSTTKLDSSPNPNKVVTTEGSTGAGASSAGPSSLPQGTSAASVDPQLTTRAWNTASPTIVQGDTLRTFGVPVNCESVQVLMKTNGRPAHSRVELWNGPNYNPFKLDVYLEKGDEYPFNAVLDTPYQNEVAMYNTGTMEFPMSADVVPDKTKEGLANIKQRLWNTGNPHTIQGGGALKTYDFDPSVKSVQVLLKTDGRHLVAKVELLQGPNNIKQKIEVYSSDGNKRPFYAVFETPYAGCVVRIVNEQTVEYPITACVEPLVVEPY